MEKGYRQVQCPGCPAILRITIAEAQYGKTLEITCPKCDTKCRATIPKPAKETAAGDPLSEAFKDVLGGNIFGDLFGSDKK
ncbi:MAG TPA: hypothetical protein VJZ94_02710 [Candidatus Paceibacterota bacterium]|uniref:Zinc finger/thioredoxin putative domain-containing protein n=1 Tax=Candidatus Lloydbacteria bacterium RIFCSPHIGHO2_02_FULL_54_17 TaxID=1798664 RepID=A0A1G2DAX3_9BACT|nr:MAG: hypothetical protein A2762_03145 [Candidatus Lloydbacteria bacterium RIFCSPHIGHO2_01_FULL_54_11]OGZ10774.1 MAG: hypothetical protein A3C93_05675 [Candidatus Lloydbacteria bacterium RIFCSPHIGHO2_02_FULL_54_17]OGZ13075.1 MAG: hypothetical protein A2948_03655 [Candidatus Lloydbacteria bacterium RIFCSPLOWO2_01_FULL_54_18]OGZ16522.1 MAG: hypothetical protein A3H76_04515 [Candidatus Lloydbacteria bacterium RIFCSPLOWO2_02_FULL_54_12]HXK31620.1 hypothetical protein [Candidatus Paceibacterota ba